MVDTSIRLLEAALAIFSEKGYAAATTREIAERAGVNEVTLFRHFGSKENLFREALTRFSPLAILTPELQAKLRGDLAHDLRLLATAYLRSSHERIEQIRIGVMEAPRNPEFARMVQQIPARLTAHLSAHLAELHARGAVRSADFAIIARLFYGLLFQDVLTRCTLGEDGRDEDALISALVDLFVRALAPDDPAAARST